METYRNRIFRMRRAAVAAFLWFLLALPCVCFSPQSVEKQAKGPADFRQAGLNRDRTQLPALLAALKNPNAPLERLSTLAALHALAQMGATEALPAINALTSTSHDISLVNFATAAKARILAESGAQSVKDPKARVQAKLNALYLGTKLTPDALNQAAKEYQVYVSTPGTPIGIGVYLMREAADILYQEGVASSTVEAMPPDYSLDPASALKVQMAPLSPKARINALVELLADEKIYAPSEPYAIQILADMGASAEQAVDTKLVDMDQHQEQYARAGFMALFDVLRCIGDSSQGPFVQDLARDQSREVGSTASIVSAQIMAGSKMLYVVGY